MIWLGRSGVEIGAVFDHACVCPGQNNVDALNQPWAGGVQVCNDMIPQVPTERH